MSCCQYCHQPMETCLQQDEKLNRPVRSSVEPKYDKIDNPLQRYEKAIKRTLGLYNPDLDEYYCHYGKSPRRLYHDTLLSLPICVFDDATSRITLLDARYDVVTDNIKVLDVEKEYKYMLLEILTDINYSQLKLFENYGS